MQRKRHLSPLQTYRATLETTTRQLADLLKQRQSFQDLLARTEGSVVDLQDAAISLGKLCGIDAAKEYPELFPESAEPDLGFTDAIREVFKGIERQKGKFLSPIEVRDALQEKGFPIHRYKNPLASIHTILKRLLSQGQLISVTTQDGLAEYRPFVRDETTAP